VSEAFSAFLDSGLCQAPGGPVEWAANGLAHRGRIASGGDYQKLQYGLQINRNGLSVAFDFGNNGEINEFDAFRLSQYFSDNRPPSDFSSTKELDAAFDTAVTNGDFRATSSQRYQLK
jgi:hypothetical protein